MNQLDTYLALFDQLLYNADPAGTIPGGAVVALRAPGVVVVGGRERIAVGRYNGTGDRFFVNSPLPIPYQKTGVGAVLERSPGVEVLYDPSTEPETNEEWGPIKDQWWIGKAGAGFAIVGMATGDPPDSPGSGVRPGTRRVRVAALPGSTAPDNVIIGRVQYPVGSQNLTFFLIEIAVIDGVDPRQNPSNPLEPVQIQNFPAKDRSSTDQVKAKQSSVSGLWFPDATATAPSALLDAKLKTDLTVDMQTVAVLLTRVPEGSELTVGQQLTAINPIDLLRTTQQKTVYEHVGNANGNCMITAYANGGLPPHTLLTVQPPNRRPIAPAT